MEHRARNHLVAWRRDFLGAFDFLDDCHADKGSGGLPDWPDWCYVPIAAALSVATEGGLGAANSSALAALSAWRMTQGIYRFDSTLYQSLIETPVTGDIPSDALYRLPEWCVYIETPDAVNYAGFPVAGAFVWLEFDVNDGRRELRMLLDIEGLSMQPAIVHLGGTVEAGIESAIDAMVKGLAGPREHETARAWADPAKKILSLLLYICSVNDFQGKGQPGQPANPMPKKTKKGVRLFGADGPAMWDVGVRMGAALRDAYHAQQVAAGGTHAGPRGHVRQAHWHSFRTGPRKTTTGDPIATQDQKLSVKWLPPIPVNLPDLDDLPATVRPVKR